MPWVRYPYKSSYVHPFHYNPQSNFSKRKGGQVRFTAYQTEVLEKQFHSNKYLPSDERKMLAKRLKLTDRQVNLIMVSSEITIQ